MTLFKFKTSDAGHSDMAKKSCLSVKKYILKERLHIYITYYSVIILLLVMVELSLYLTYQSNFVPQVYTRRRKHSMSGAWCFPRFQVPTLDKGGQSYLFI